MSHPIRPLDVAVTAKAHSTIRLRRNVDSTAAISERKAFRNGSGSMRAQWCASGHASVFFETGSLPSAFVALLNQVRRPVYVVYSYDTPIAWASEGDEVMTVPAVVYSQTTTQHQHLCIGGWVSSRNPDEHDFVQFVGEYVDAHGQPESFHNRIKADKVGGRSPFGPRNGW